MEKIFANPDTLYVDDRGRWMELMQSGDRYQKTLVSFSNDLAISIQKKMNDGIILEDAAKESLKEVSEKFSNNGEHISLTMKKKSIEILADVWKHPFNKKLSEWYCVFCR